MPVLSLINIHKSFGETRALDGVSFDVALGEIVALLGPSGCGKSTLLSLIAGLNGPDRGDILWEGRSLAGVPTHKRGFGLMFQDYMLFPHMNVGQNVGFGLKFTSSNESQPIEQLLTLVGLPGFEKRDVSTLSGGEQQRVALARSLAPKPRLLMLDEPLGSLDRTLRERLLGELRGILRQLEQTAIYVTHDQEEAFTLADRVVVMCAGTVEQIGTPQEIYQRPASPFVARFLGFGNLLEGRVMRVGQVWMVKTEVGEFPINGDRVGSDEKVIVLIRPDGAQLADEGGKYQLQGFIQEKSFRGSVQRVEVKVKEVAVTFDFPARVTLPGVGEQLLFAIDLNAIQIFRD